MKFPNLFRKRAARSDESVLGSVSVLASSVPTSSTGGSGSRSALAPMRDLLRMAHRDLLRGAAIPPSWLTMEILRTGSSAAGRQEGLHARMVLCHWEPRLLVHAPALEQCFMQHVHALDPRANAWFTGMSWQLLLAGVPSTHADLPPDAWRQRKAHVARSPAAHGPAAATPEKHEAQAVASDVRHVRGVRSSDPAASQDEARLLRADMEKLLAIRDADAHQVRSFAKTQPMSLLN